MVTMTCAPPSPEGMIGASRGRSGTAHLLSWSRVAVEHQRPLRLWRYGVGAGSGVVVGDTEVVRDLERARQTSHRGRAPGQVVAQHQRVVTTVDRTHPDRARARVVVADHRPQAVVQVD